MVLQNPCQKLTAAGNDRTNLGNLDIHYKTLHMSGKSRFITRIHLDI